MKCARCTMITGSVPTALGKMNERNQQKKRAPSCLWTVILFVVLMASVVGLLVNVYRPDRPIEKIVPGSSDDPTFRVQIIRPRAGLPLGGLLPPDYFGVDAELGFDSTSENAGYDVGSNVLELSGGDWELRLVFDDNRRITAESEIVFNLIFEERIRRVRCSPGDAVASTLEIIELDDANELSGSFELELPICEDAESGTDLGWPPEPFVLRGSFDRLQIENHSD